MLKRFAAVVVCVSAITAGCGGGTRELDLNTPRAPTAPATSPPSATSTASQAREPSVEMNAPGQGATVAPGNVQTSVLVAGIKLVDKLGEDKKKGEGHVIFYLDVDDLPTDPDEPAFVDDEARFHATPTVSHTWSISQLGEHKLSAQLVNNDHTPLDPPATHSITIKVIEPPPTTQDG